MTTTRGAPAEVSRSAATVPHPLDPLHPTEFTRVAALLRDDRRTAGLRVISIDLHEPSKEALRRFEATAARPAREAFVVLHDVATGVVHECVASLTSGAVTTVRHVPGVFPPVTLDDLEKAAAAVRAHPGFQQALRSRGVSDPSLAHIEPWPGGHRLAGEDTGQRRIARALTWIRGQHPEDNPYARPVEGLVVLVDLDRAEVIAIKDSHVVPLPEYPGNYVPELLHDPRNVPRVRSLRDDVAPLEITQPRGPSFTVDGYEVRWQKWSFRVGFTRREGLVLHQIRYADGDRVRPILHRASLAEMWVPYGDPAETHRSKNVFDEGEVGLGFTANSLRLGCDCLGEIRYLDGVVNDSHGEPVVIPQAICLHEEDTGIAWKHTNSVTRRADVRRGRRFVASSISTVGNYEYGFFWYFNTDGSIEFEVKLTGIVSTGAFPAGETPAHGTVIASGLYGPNHQHFFSVRLDVEVDGPHNTVYEVDSVALPPGPGNPLGNAWVTRWTPLVRESSAQRMANPAAARSWLIVNERSRNRHGRPVAFQLLPGTAVTPLHHPDSPALRRARFATRHVWVTAYHPRQRYAAGDYVYLNPGEDGLPAWVAANRNVRDTDIVVWHTVGEHHVVRPEDWPVMPVVRAGFHLRPVGFFDGNPALDLPPPEPDHCHPHVRHGGADEHQPSSSHSP